MTVTTIGALAVATACGGSDGPTTSPAPTLNPADFTTTIDNPLFPLSSLGAKVFEGDEKDEDGVTVHTRIEHTTLADTEVIGGVTALVLQDKEYQDGELVEATFDYFAQHRDGSVWYLGERVDEYENGGVTGHGGQWLSGDGPNRAGVYMPAAPSVGQEFAQENAPGVAEDRSKVIAIDQTVIVPAGSFTECLKAEDSSPLEDVSEFKYYCPGVGLVREEPPAGTVDLISYQ